MMGLFEQAIQNFSAGRYPEAKAILDSMERSAGKDADYLRLRGLTLAHMGDLEGALASFRKAVQKGPDIAANHLNLADHYRRLAQFRSAAQHYRKATGLDPVNDHARTALADVLVRLGEIATRDQARTFAQGRPEMMVASAMAMNEVGDKDEAIRLLEDVVAITPHWLDGVALLRRFRSERVRSWHFPMMRDTARNAAYQAALNKAVGPDSLVLEIGTGSGLLAMMAARAGAARVTTCEIVGVVAETAAEIVRANGLSDTVTVVAKPSQKLEVGVDLPRRADVLVAEIIGDELLTEGVLEATRDARRRLLKTGARLIPRKVASVACLVGGAALEQLLSVESEAGFDLSAFNRFTPGAMPLSPRGLGLVRHSAKQAVFTFDLTDEAIAPEEKMLEFTVSEAGRCVGVLQWVRLDLDDETSFENEPTDGFQPSGWRPMLFPFAAPMEVSAGQVVKVWAKHNVVSQVFLLAD